MGFPRAVGLGCWREKKGDNSFCLAEKEARETNGHSAGSLCVALLNLPKEPFGSRYHYTYFVGEKTEVK